MGALSGSPITLIRIFVCHHFYEFFVSFCLERRIFIMRNTLLLFVVMLIMPVSVFAVPWAGPEQPVTHDHPYVMSIEQQQGITIEEDARVVAYEMYAFGPPDTPLGQEVTFFIDLAPPWSPSPHTFSQSLNITAEGWLYIDWSSEIINVTSGQQITIGWSVTSGQFKLGGAWATPPGEPDYYTGGTLWYTDGSNVFESPEADAAFKLWLIPEPTTLALLAAGALGLLGYGWRRKRR
jgi:hypothetical protein